MSLPTIPQCQATKMLCVFLLKDGDHSYGTKRQRNIRGTRKLGCSATITIKEIILFDDYKASVFNFNCISNSLLCYFCSTVVCASVSSVVTVQRLSENLLKYLL